MYVDFPTNRVTPGSRFGRYTVLSTHKKKGTYLYYAFCQCDCGSEPRHVLISCIQRGEAQSCGCLHRERVTKHGKWGHPCFTSWSRMMSRCYNPKDKRYSRYGGRGITVAAEWHDVAKFFADMGDGFKKGLTIDRIDNNGPYCKANCRWATTAQQNRNYSRNKMFSHAGKTLCLKEWSELLGINYGTLWDRLYVQNKPFSEAIS